MGMTYLLQGVNGIKLQHEVKFLMTLYYHGINLHN
ncbi:unnamed protein product [Acanthoscelides obtectus]|uniref:Uncharacterized protein n=1 Tax=Acanthoscelides obtectus TaxID=200917 RepID=A0A9P0PGH1_ACAOB|nr:unnamed protein product [Acanthoscelides obtectus]CAK1632821.1 hypothetical protein AOBTE_LOCUS7749 [Acanthoscelides obtectus]